MNREQNPRSVQDAIYLSMRHNIRTLNLPPGAAISETEVSQVYKVSRTPVREAFIRLAEEALIKVVPQKETVVSRIDLKRVEQERFLREALETAALEPFIQKHRPEHFVHMEEQIKLQEKALTAKENIQFMFYDDMFHQTLFIGAEQELCGGIVKSMSGHYYRIRLLSIMLNGVADDVISHHQLLLTALKNNDLNAARNLLKVHLHNLEKEEKLIIEQFPHYLTAGEDEALSIDFGNMY